MKIGPRKSSGKLMFPAKLACKTWIASLHICLTQDSLRRRGIVLCCRSYLCNEETEAFTLISTLHNCKRHLESVWSAMGDTEQINEVFIWWGKWKCKDSRKIDRWFLLPSFGVYGRRENLICFGGVSMSSVLKSRYLVNLFCSYKQKLVGNAEYFLDLEGSLYFG